MLLSRDKAPVTGKGEGGQTEHCSQWNEALIQGSCV